MKPQPKEGLSWFDHCLQQCWYRFCFSARQSFPKIAFLCLREFMHKDLNSTSAFFFCSSLMTLTTSTNPWLLLTFSLPTSLPLLLCPQTIPCLSHLFVPWSVLCFRKAGLFFSEVSDTSKHERLNFLKPSKILF